MDFFKLPSAVSIIEKALPQSTQLTEALNKLVLSASGWRGVFAQDAGEYPKWLAPNLGQLSDTEKKENSLSPKVGATELVIISVMAEIYCKYLQELTGKNNPRILLGLDSRPTGPALAEAMLRIFLALGAEVEYLGVIAAPPIMAYARTEGDGFAYISASHNPPAHNGVKFGATKIERGGVLPGREITPMIAKFKQRITYTGIASDILTQLHSVGDEQVATVLTNSRVKKNASLIAYNSFSREVLSGISDEVTQHGFFRQLAEAAREFPLGIVIDFNGSARAASIDIEFLQSLGLKVHAINTELGQFAHRIVPEGNSLEDCRRALEVTHKQDPAFLLGYVPDCDGDRGNLVYFDEVTQGAKILMAQEVFALCVFIELANLIYTGEADKHGRDKIAVVVNDATSMRIEAIAHAFGFTVFRSETGEANVVERAHEARAQGYLVRILGEGSNGGNITFPASVRDPLATLGSLVKLLLLRDKANGEKGIMHLWQDACKLHSVYVNKFTLADCISSLPQFITTNAFESVALLQIKTTDHSQLKARYQKFFNEAWSLDKKEFSSLFGIYTFKAFATKGTQEIECTDNFALSERGGLRIVFFNNAQVPVAFVWMRGSGTEPVFRVMADIEGNSQGDHDYLLTWHKNIIARADAV